MMYEDLAKTAYALVVNSLGEYGILDRQSKELLQIPHNLENLPIDPSPKYTVLWGARDHAEKALQIYREKYVDYLKTKDLFQKRKSYTIVEGV